MFKRILVSAFFAFLLTTTASPAAAACPTFADLAGNWVARASGEASDLVSLSLYAATVQYVQILPTGRFKAIGASVAGNESELSGVTKGRLRILNNCLLKVTDVDAGTGAITTWYLAVINPNKMVGVQNEDTGFGVYLNISLVVERAEFGPF